MAKRVAVKKRAVKRAVRKKPVKRSAGVSRAFRDDDHLHDDNSICACDFEFSENDATADADLPMARGGMQA